MTNASAQGRCGSCVHFRNDPAFLEKTFAGLGSLSSGYGSASGSDGICLLHDRHLSARASCAQYSAAAFRSDIAAVDPTLKSTADRVLERVLME